MNKISFDYDSTLSRKDVQEYAKELLSRGFEVIITTTRTSSDTSAYKINGARVGGMNDDLYEAADSLGIPRYNITFTEGSDKVDYIEEDVIFHLDDDVVEYVLLGDKCVHLKDNFWKTECELKIAKKLKDRHNLVDSEKINRFEVIDENGRSYVKYFVNAKLELSIQDEGRTLKIFIK